MPTDPDILAQFKMVVDGSKPQEAYLCGELGIAPGTNIEGGLERCF